MTIQVAAGKARGPVRPPVILVVEDEPLMRSTTGEYLRLSGYVVIEATGAAEAIALIGRGERPDAVFSAVSLSGRVYGLSLARWLRRGRPDLRVRLTSGYGDPARRAAIEVIGCECFLPNPYHQEELAHRLDTLLGPDRGATG